jgi:N-acetylglucosaminyl-diphospho-decaprenol L-rhamnosyltransferase
MSASARLSVIIVTWNNAANIEACLNWLQASETPFTLEVIVVDNCSSDQTFALAENHSSRPWVIQNVRNDGVARGNNVGFEACVGDYVLFLRPDMMLRSPSALKRMLAFLGTNIEYAAVAPRLVNEKGDHLIGDAGYRVTLWHTFTDCLGLTRLFQRIRGLNVCHPSILERTSVEVDWLTGRCLLTRRTVLERVGGFDERGSLYGSDIEWAMRLKAHGFRLAYVPSVAVEHSLPLPDPQEEALPSHYPPLSRSWVDRVLTQYGDTTESVFRRNLLRAILGTGFALRGIRYALGGITEGRNRELSRIAWRCAGHAFRAPYD